MEANLAKANKHIFTPTKTPDRLKEYSPLPVFGGPKDLPKREEPTGPFICSKSLKLSKQEYQILSKDPKYSLMQDCDRDTFSLESERMLAKNRFNHSFRNKKNKAQRGGLKTTTN